MLKSRSPLATTALAVAGSVSVVGLLAGCSAAAQTTDSASSQAPDSASDSTATQSTTETSDETTTESSSDDTASGSYADGTYSAEGSYTSPGGNESIAVELTLTDDVVTALTVTSEAVNPQAKTYQEQFISGINAEVVGQSIDELSVGVVAGSSLTSGGFNAALETIKADAAA